MQGWALIRVNFDPIQEIEPKVCVCVLGGGGGGGGGEGRSLVHVQYICTAIQ